MWPSWQKFEEELPALGTPFFFSTKSTNVFWNAPLGQSESAVLIFGRETGGLPPEIHDAYGDHFVTIPIDATIVRSLNLSTSVAVAVYETLRQQRTRPKG